MKRFPFLMTLTIDDIAHSAKILHVSTAPIADPAHAN